MTEPPRVGLGVDVHPRDPARPLRLGGVSFDGEPGLAGHSDGDAVCHAVADALLGAAALGDIGEHFPESDPGLEGIAGSELRLFEQSSHTSHLEETEAYLATVRAFLRRVEAPLTV